MSGKGMAQGPTSVSVVKQSKYRSRNPISTFLLGRFFRALGRLLSVRSFDTVLEIGCGEGLLLHRLRPQLGARRVAAIDIDAEDVALASRNSPFASYAVASAYALPFRDHAFELTVCCEVLEHLAFPDRALAEIERVTSAFSVLSVPDEPLWRVLNVLRGAYLGDWGNTPGHVNHWSHRAFAACAEEHFDVLSVIRPRPWTVLLCGKRARFLPNA
jgi:2-polyprenyl-3-methyl-5-hydroxy-6-metoxy-1,4-benzoquinol methylase